MACGLSEFKWLVAVATQQNKYEVLFSFHTTFMDFGSNDVSDDEGQRLFAAFQIFWKQQKGIHQKATTSIPQKRIVEEDSKDELEEDSSEDDGGDGEDLYGTQALFNSIRRGQ